MPPKEKQPSRAKPLLQTPPPPADQRVYDLPHAEILNLALYRLFTEEERLIPLLNNDDPVDRETVLHAVAVARELKWRGFPSYLIPLDECLDIAQIFRRYNPRTAWDMSRDELHPPKTKITDKLNYPHTNEEKIIQRVVLTSWGPDTNSLKHALKDILASLKEKGNSSWTARVCAALAYFASDSSFG